MENTLYRHRRFTASLIMCVGAFLSGFQVYADTRIYIGVRAHSGHEIALKKWSGTAQYLSQKIQGYDFAIQPIVEFEEMKQAVKQNKINFILTNPAAYIELEKDYGVSRIATLVNRRGNDATNEFGAIIFTHAKRFDINQLSDLKSKSYVGVHPQAFGGWWMALGELKNNNINPFEYCKEISFVGTQESVVFSVLNGEMDVGTVRTGIIERLARNGDISLSDIKVLNQRQDDFSLPHSTDLYPEWPMAKSGETSADLAEKVAQALFEIHPENMAAVTGNYTGWTVPLSYRKIHDLLKDLKVGAYAEYGEFTFIQVVNKYWLEIISFLVVLFISLFVTGYIVRVNKALTIAKLNLEKEVSERKIIQQELEENLSEIRKLQGILPICSYCKKIRDDDGYWEQVDVYIHQHSDADFSHGICPQCMEVNHPEEYKRIHSRNLPVKPKRSD